MKRYIIVILIFTTIFCNNAFAEVNAQYNEIPLFNQLIFLTSTSTQNSSEKLEDGVRAFILAEEVPSNSFFKNIKLHLSSSRKSFIVLLFEGNPDLLYSKLKNEKLTSFLYQLSTEDWPNSSDLIKANKRLLVFSKKDFPHFLSLNQFVGKWEYAHSANQIKPINNPSADLALVYFSNKDSIFHPNNLINSFNLRCGKMPNFMVAQNQKNLIQTIKRQNKVRRPQAIVMQGGQKVDAVKWLQFPAMNSYGNLFLPPKHKRISPKKNGFRFSPDVVSFTLLNMHIAKKFQTIKLELSEGLIAHFPFDNDLKNYANAEYQPELISEVELVTDSKRGAIATFNGETSYIDCGIPEKNYFENNFTISLWIKPNRLDNNRSILGKGETFSAKIKDSALLFTIPGVKDHSNFKNEIELNKWQHIAYVFNAGHSIQFYKNGQLAFEYSASEMKHTQHALLIGSNLWDEFYSGFMDELCIWQRGLSAQEISEIFERGLPPNSESKYKWLFIVMACAIAVILLFYYRYISKKQSPKQKAEPISPPITKQPKARYHIQLFGGFNILNQNNHDLTNRFSPKRKQLFILILLYSLKTGKGITSKKMTDFLWEGHSAQSAKNNRSTNIQRVREILEENTGLQILYHDKFWKVSISPEVTCDFAQYIQLTQAIQSDQFQIHYLKEYLSILSKGELLPNMEYEWLDTIQSHVTEQVLNTLFSIVENRKQELTSELLIKIAEVILLFDPVNEEATLLKINTLIRLGMNKPAKDIYHHFCRSYHNFYGEEFGKSYKNFIEN